MVLQECLGVRTSKTCMVISFDLSVIFLPQTSSKKVSPGSANCPTPNKNPEVDQTKEEWLAPKKHSKNFMAEWNIWTYDPLSHFNTNHCNTGCFNNGPYWLFTANVRILRSPVSLTGNKKKEEGINWSDAIMPMKSSSVTLELTNVMKNCSLVR